MKYQEYSPEKPETILLLHGGGLSWWSFREAAELLQEDYRVILPILDGHAGSDRPFTAIESNAAELVEFLDRQFGGSVLAIGGLSLGAQILLEMLSQRENVCRYAVVESAAAIPSKLTHAMIGPAFGSSYALIKNRRFSKLQFRSLRIKPALFEEYYRDTCQIAKADMISFLKASTAYAPKQTLCSTQAQIRIAVGRKEQKSMLQSAKLLHEMLPGSRLETKDGLYHGEYSINHAAQYVRELREMFKEESVDAPVTRA